jgi:lipoate-protein ligase B
VAIVDATKRITNMPANPSARVIVALRLGLISYEKALVLQNRLAEARTQQAIPDVLVLLKHPPVFTVGRFRGVEELLVPPGDLQTEGIPLVRTNRGGSITYHGPEQIIGYPILNLRELGVGVREYVWKLEEVIIRVLDLLQIQGRRRPSYPGVWVGEDKICSIGIHVSHGITTHGFALNLGSDLDHFDSINPCGLRGIRMTSIAQKLGYSPFLEDILENLTEGFSETFRLRVSPETGVLAEYLDSILEKEVIL